ncbi:hypothetical protein PHYBLDRAFT_143601 [Phycomyces blakesleeanus NRRL 1555(-)]|uniref:Uncharacterized protein n=1 Tax=Phycomyces blakesleeanus (strain ATCC 8743b / DSM 1359 / FGSC 10004 / NBRC 33097 / NRRL 1555) TaxID=763407 RepID=A0A162XJN8_PHYB8|nr:hypothetical protein PHYBLDRAFT_143601 [Phycomyces blakesleeanus NRRL 1555(-)]OAD75345.1 hypothetical protein PHYBLDRAFT_143601 [Phycomyces blakesleeanus NRRL 1555(-)]|eukprot:XP_018293385.1 hypothetical protein PHYBLDRAFT_143601 [Phycomyces blakesleeanus NRRL 1555(-)]
MSTPAVALPSKKTSSSPALESSLVEGLRKEAYSELHRQVEPYNDKFVANMRHIEAIEGSGVPFQTLFGSLSSDTTGSEKSKHNQNVDTLEDLITTIGKGSIKDYSVFTEWELSKNPHMAYDDQGEYGNLW